MPVKKLKDFLDDHHVKYVCLSHSPAFTAQEIAATTHISGKELAKTVIIDIDGKLAIVVVPANDHVNMAALQQVTGAKRIELANEMAFKHCFPGCEVGAMPPFGSLYGMEVFIAHGLTTRDVILFNAGSHSELIQMLYADFERLAKPVVFSN